MKYSNREKLSNYFDLFFLFIELDIFIWVLFELSHSFRPIMYEVGRVLVIIFILEIIAQFFLGPTPVIFLRKCWYLFVFAAVLFFLFNRLSAVDISHRFIFLYSRLFLLAVLSILFAKFLLQANRIKEIYKTFRVYWETLKLKMCRLEIILSLIIMSKLRRKRKASLKYFWSL